MKGKYLGGILCMAAAIVLTAGCSRTADTSAAANKTNEVTVQSQSIGLEGVNNARQVGGYITQDGRKVKEGVLLRTGALAAATEEDIAELENKYQVSQIVDFRTSEERASAPDPEISGARNTPIPLTEEDSEEDDEENGTTAGYTDYSIESMVEIVRAGVVDQMYVTMVEDAYTQQAYGTFFQELLNHEEGAFLWHCTGGKDRAGLASVLLLSALGVDRETILADFELSNHYYAETVEQMLKAAEDLDCTEEDREGLRGLFGVRVELMKDALKVIDEKYESMEKYLTKQLGLSDDDISRLQEKFLEI